MSDATPDPVLVSARREALIVGATWLSAMVYTVTYVAMNGYGRAAGEIKLIWGVPDWVFWGIFTPWTLCTLFAFAFSYFIVRDDDLGEELPTDDDPAEAPNDE